MNEVYKILNIKLGLLLSVELVMKSAIKSSVFLQFFGQNLQETVSDGSPPETKVLYDDSTS